MRKNRKCIMPQLFIFEKSKENRYFLQWTDPETNKRKTKSCTYGKKYTKEEAYDYMLDVRCKVMEKWMEDVWNLKTEGTQTESVEMTIS